MNAILKLAELVVVPIIVALIARAADSDNERVGKALEEGHLKRRGRHHKRALRELRDRELEAERRARIDADEHRELQKKRGIVQVRGPTRAAETPVPIPGISDADTPPPVFGRDDEWGDG
jgi:hypothetical protein